MPVNVDVGNSIIQAFLAGHQMAFERQKRQDELAKEKFSQELATKKYQEDIRQFNEQAKRAQEQFAAEQNIRESQNKLAELSARQGIVENYQKGIAIPGLTENQYSPTDIGQNVQPGQASVNVSPGRIFTPDIITQPNTVTISHPTLGTFNIPTREAAATEQARIQDILLGPQKRMKIEEERAKMLEEMSKLFYQEKFTGAENEKNRQNAYNIALLRIKAENDPNKKKEIWDNTPVTTQEAVDLKDHGIDIPVGTLHKDIAGKTPGIKLTAPQDEKLTYLRSMLQDARDAQLLLDPEKGGIGYDRYFLGKSGFSLTSPLGGLTSGLGTEQLSKLKGETDETQAVIRNKLGAVFDKRKVESAGKVLNAAELKLLQNYVPPYEHTLNPTQARVNLDNFISGTYQLIKDLESQYSHGTLIKDKVNSTSGAGTLDLNKFIVPRK